MSENFDVYEQEFKALMDEFTTYGDRFSYTQGGNENFMIIKPNSY